MGGRVRLVGGALLLHEFFEGVCHVGTLNCARLSPSPRRAPPSGLTCRPSIGMSRSVFVTCAFSACPLRGPPHPDPRSWPFELRQCPPRQRERPGREALLSRPPHRHVNAPRVQPLSAAILTP